MYVFTVVFFFLFFKQKTAYEMRISDWSSDVCSSDLMLGVPLGRVDVRLGDSRFPVSAGSGGQWGANSSTAGVYAAFAKLRALVADKLCLDPASVVFENRSEENTSELQSLMRISYAVYCLKKKTQHLQTIKYNT